MDKITGQSWNRMEGDIYHRNYEQILGTGFLNIRSSIENAFLAGARLEPIHEMSLFRDIGTDPKDFIRTMLKNDPTCLKDIHMGDFQRAFSSSDIPEALRSVLTTIIHEFYRQDFQSWQKITKVVPLQDFKPSTIGGVGLRVQFADVSDGKEYRHTMLGMDGETSQLGTYGGILEITEEAFLSNPDLWADMGQEAVDAAGRKASDLFVGALVDNAELSDGVPVFDALHGNLGSSTGTAAERIQELITLLGSQTDQSGEPLYLQPYSLLAGSDQMLDYEAACVALVPGNTEAENESFSQPIRRAYDPRLSGTGKLFLFCKNPSISMLSLGRRTLEPEVFPNNVWNTGNKAFKSRVDVGVVISNFRGLTYSPGV